MDLKTKAKALEKADKTYATIAYDDFVLDDTAVDKFYDEVTDAPLIFFQVTIRDGASFGEAMKTVVTWYKHWCFGRLVQTVRRDIFVLPTASSNAYFHPALNQLGKCAGAF